MDELPDIKDFVRAINVQRLAYLMYLKSRGYEIEPEELDDLRHEIASASPGKTQMALAVEELQAILALIDGFDDPRNRYIKATLYVYGFTKLQMRPDKNHRRAHFHIDYKTEHSASYSVDTLEKLAGFMPRKYEEPILAWASQHQRDLQLTWDEMQKGENVRELIVSEDA